MMVMVSKVFMFGSKLQNLAIKERFFVLNVISTHENENVFYSSKKLPVKIDLSSLSLNGKMLIFIFRFKVC